MNDRDLNEDDGALVKARYVEDRRRYFEELVEWAVVTLAEAGFKDVEFEIDVRNVQALVARQRKLLHDILDPRLGECFEEKRYPTRGLTSLVSGLVDRMLALDFPVSAGAVAMLSLDLRELGRLDRESLADKVNDLKCRPPVHKDVRARMETEAEQALEKLLRDADVNGHLRAKRYGEVAEAMDAQIRERTKGKRLGTGVPESRVGAVEEAEADEAEPGVAV
jgi:hypothetical protein